MEPLRTVIRCNLCTHKSDTHSHLRTHLQTYHEGCKIGYECFFCNKLYKTPYLHREHLRRRHGDHCDFTTPPPTGRIDPRKLAKKPGIHIPPVEARTMPTPPKRRKTEPVVSKPQPPSPEPFNLDAILQSDLNVSDHDDESPPRDKATQVRRRDFLTTSREIQATTTMVDQHSQVTLYGEKKDVGSQTVSNSIDCTSQTMGPMISNTCTGTQTTPNHQGTQTLRPPSSTEGGSRDI